MLAGTARVGNEPVALDDDRELRLRHLDRDVRREAGRVGEAVVAVPDRSPAPGADDELVEDEPAAITLEAVGAEDRKRVAALASRRNAIGDQLGQRAVERIEHSEARNAAH